LFEALANSVKVQISLLALIPFVLVRP